MGNILLLPGGKHQIGSTLSLPLLMQGQYFDYLF
jgi:hypothetical protein